MNLLEQLKATVGEANVLTEPADTAPYLTDWRKRYTGRAQAVVRPATTDEVAAVVRLCAQARTPIVPQGGNTGLVGGGTPDDTGRAILLSLGRMNRVRAVDPVNNTITVEAGCPLQRVQEAAAEAGRLFPLSLAAEGTATIGGNLSTNAGGTQVLRYGNARELALGLEVVLPSGELWDGLRGLRKDNTGYDLRDLFIGAEGTLGVITAACLKTFPLPRGEGTALLAVRSVEAALALLEVAQSMAGPALTGFELFSDLCLRTGRTALPAAPVAAGRALALLRAAAAERPRERRARDGAAAGGRGAGHRTGPRDRRRAGAVGRAGARPVGPARVRSRRPRPPKAGTSSTTSPCRSRRSPASWPRPTRCWRSSCPASAWSSSAIWAMATSTTTSARRWARPMAEFVARQPAVYRLVHDQVARHAGSISAEHGIGQLKRVENQRYKSPVELALMRRLKETLDPLGIMNPGKVV